LDGALERPSAVHRVIAHAGQPMPLRS
jgi:hypothetical protein